jgi:hypothetical protein
MHFVNVHCYMCFESPALALGRFHYDAPPQESALLRAACQGFENGSENLLSLEFAP